jgi:hypothetical protein
VSEFSAQTLQTSGRATYLPTGWPIYALFLGFPLWWVLGLGGFIWLILAIPMAAWLFRQPTVLAPRGFAIWIAFLLWMLGSATQLDDPDRYIAFGYRASLYLAATIVLLYVFNISREALPTSRVIVIMAAFWMVVVVGGFLGVLFPNLEFTSPVEAMLPQRLVSDGFVYELVHPATAQIHTFLGYPQPRPKAPFVYATNWGSAFGLLTPFVILGWAYVRTRPWKILTACMFVAAIVPVVNSLSRGLWISLGAGLVYAAIRLAMAGQGRALRAILILVPTLLAVVYLSPLKTLVEDRFEHPHSNETRAGLYEEATAGVLESPVFGYGSPRPSERNSTAPSVGTQGQLWLVLFSHGFPGALLFLWFLLYQFWRLRRLTTQVAFWCHVLLLIALVQLPVYGYLPGPLVIIMIGIALAAREQLLGPVTTPEHESGGRAQWAYSGGA